MAIFKSLSPDDISRVPFNANKQFTFTSSSAGTIGFTTERFEYTSSILDTFSSASTDSKNIIKYYQLDHLFYRNHRLDIANKFGDADYLAENRTLYDKVNVISIPSKLYGNKVKPGTFVYSSSLGKVIDDSKGNLIISGTNLISHSIDERERVFNLGPVKGFKKYNLNYDLYGKRSPHKIDYYNDTNIYDDSYYNNTLTYKNIIFRKENPNSDLLTENGIQTHFDENHTGWSVDTGITPDFSGDGLLLSSAGKTTVEFQYIPVDFNAPSIASSYLAQQAIGFPNLGQIRLHIELKNANTEAINVRLRSISFKEITDYPTANFINNNKITSSIVSPHNETYNFNPGEDFTIAMHVNPVSASGYLISKNTTKTVIKTPINQKTYTTGSSQPFNIRAESHYPFEIFIDDKQHLTFRKYDGNFTPTISASINTGSIQHVVCMSSASRMEIWISGSKITSGSDTTVNQTENHANLYLGSKGEISNFYTGSLANVMIYNSSRTQVQIESLYSSSNGSPYVGNIFYSNGLATITHPNHLSIAQPFISGNVAIDNPLILFTNSSSIGTDITSSIANQNEINDLYNLPFLGSLEYKIQFKNIHPIYENEYQCTINADEYNYTHNISTRKIKSDQKPELANFTTSSFWKPYVTTIGLYNQNHELLVVGKLGQPVRMSDETDTTFVLRWDT